MRSISFTIVIAMLVACSENQGSGDDIDGGGGGEPDAYVADDASNDVGQDTDPVACPTSDVGSIWGRVYDQETFDPLASVSVCVLNRPELACVVSDLAGIYAIPCVPTGDAELEYVAPGYPRELWAWSSRYGINEDVNLGILHFEHHAQYLAPTGETFPDGRRALVTIDFIGEGVVDGATVALRRGTGAGPFYTRYEGGTVDPAITSIGSHMEYAYFIAEAMPGEREIEITVTPGPSGTRCTQYYGDWRPSDDAPNTMRVPVEPDVVSVIFLNCE